MLISFLCNAGVNERGLCNVGVIVICIIGDMFGLKMMSVEHN